MYRLSDYSYDLPESRIAQHPVPGRSDSRLLRLEKKTNTVSHHRFSDIKDLLTPGDVLVVNDTKVIPARLNGCKETGGKVEVLIIDYMSGLNALKDDGYFECDCLIKASKRPLPGSVLQLGEELTAQVISHAGAVSKVRFSTKQEFIPLLETIGKMPLPPYIKRESPADEDRNRYQTVYASHEGAVAAPTAGLHFTTDLMAQLEKKGVQVVPLTLHVGYGTFVPVKVNDIRDHNIHHEYFSLQAPQADIINRAKAEKRRIVAVGTTVVRTLEYLADDSGKVSPGTGMCDLFIYPGYAFRCVDAMITNFHLPESTLLMLVSAFHNREDILAVYNLAVTENYRFFSYGDAMLIE